MKIPISTQPEQLATQPQPGEPLMPPDISSEADYRDFLHSEGVTPGSEAEQHILEGRQMYKDVKARQEEASAGAGSPAEPAVLESMLGNIGDQGQNDRIRVVRVSELKKLEDEGQLFVKPGQARDLGARAVSQAQDQDPIQIRRT